jgi:hypothetical protein
VAILAGDTGGGVTSAVPEPGQVASSPLLLALGAAGVAIQRQRAKKKQAEAVAPLRSKWRDDRRVVPSLRRAAPSARRVRIRDEGGSRRKSGTTQPRHRAVPRKHIVDGPKGAASRVRARQRSSLQVSMLTCH